MSRERGDRTKSKILAAGLEMWLENPNSVSANGIGNRIGMKHASILYHFPYGVKDAVAEHAVNVGNSRVIAQLIVSEHPAVKNLSASDRMKHLKASI